MKELREDLIKRIRDNAKIGLNEKTGLNEDKGIVYQEPLLTTASFGRW
jgi:hypothetical protein